MLKIYSNFLTDTLKWKFFNLCHQNIDVLRNETVLIHIQESNIYKCLCTVRVFFRKCLKIFFARELISANADAQQIREALIFTKQMCLREI